MPPFSQEDRILGEKRIREQLGLPMMSANPTNSVSEETLQIEREILGVQAYGFGEIWSRPALTIQERCFITLSVLTTKYQQGPLADYVGASLRVGITPGDILDAILHTGVYAGITAASEGLNTARRVFTEKGITAPSDDEITPVYPMTREGRVEAQRRIGKDISIARHGPEADAGVLQFLKSGAWTEKANDLPTELEFNLINGEYGYGENWGRPTLGLRVRSMLTLASLQAQFANDQFHFHLNNALNIGLTGDEIHEVIGHVGIYAGGANWRNAANVVRDMLLQRGIVKPAG